MIVNTLVMHGLGFLSWTFRLLVNWRGLAMEVATRQEIRKIMTAKSFKLFLLKKTRNRVYILMSDYKMSLSPLKVWSEEGLLRRGIYGHARLGYLTAWN